MVPTEKNSKVLLELAEKKRGAPSRGKGTLQPSREPERGRTSQVHRRQAKREKNMKP